MWKYLVPFVFVLGMGLASAHEHVSVGVGVGIGINVHPRHDYCERDRVIIVERPECGHYEDRVQKFCVRSEEVHSFFVKDSEEFITDCHGHVTKKVKGHWETKVTPAEYEERTVRIWVRD